MSLGLEILLLYGWVEDVGLTALQAAGAEAP